MLRKSRTIFSALQRAAAAAPTSAALKSASPALAAALQKLFSTECVAGVAGSHQGNENLCSEFNPLRGIAPRHTTRRSAAQRVLARYQGSATAELDQSQELVQQLDAADGAVDDVVAVATSAADVGFRDKAFLGSLAERVVSVTPQLSPQQAMAVAEAFARLELFDLNFNDTVVDLIMARLDDFDGATLGRTLRALGALGYYEDDLLDAVANRLEKQPTAFSSCDVANIAYLYSKVGACHPGLLNAVEASAPVWLKEEDNVAAMTSVMDAFARMGCYNSTVLYSITGHVVDNAPQLPARHLASMLWSFSRLGFKDRDLYDALCRGLRGKLGELSAKDIAKVVISLGDVQHLDDSLMRAVAEEVLPARVGEFNPLGLSNMVRACNQMGFYSTTLAKAASGKL